MALTDYIGIRGHNAGEPFQGIAGGTSTTGDTAGDTGTDIILDTQALSELLEKALLTAEGESILGQPVVLDDETTTAILDRYLMLDGTSLAALMDKAWLHHDGDTITALMEKAFLYKDGETFFNIFEKALLYTDKDDPTVKSILHKALLYVKNTDGRDVLESVLHDMLKDLAFVDAILDFGFMRVHIKGKMIEYTT